MSKVTPDVLIWESTHGFAGLTLASSGSGGNSIGGQLQLSERRSGVDLTLVIGALRRSHEREVALTRNYEAACSQ